MGVRRGRGAEGQGVVAQSKAAGQAFIRLRSLPGGRPEQKKGRAGGVSGVAGEGSGPA